MPTPIHDILFSGVVRETQAAFGSRDRIAGLEARNHWRSELSEEQARFIVGRDSFYLGTASLAGRPYIQHRGGPPSVRFGVTTTYTQELSLPISKEGYVGFPISVLSSGPIRLFRQMTIWFYDACSW